MDQKVPKFVTVDGLRFARDEKSGYYRANTPRGVHKTALLHRYLWERSNGPIPKGCHVHHVDGDRANNAMENLVLMTASEHRAYHKANPTDKAMGAWHRNIKKAQDAARQWHRSPEGRAWHRKHAVETHRPLERHERKCDCCGKSFMAASFQRFCSANCKQKWRWHSGIDDVVVVCPVCNREFKTNKNKPTETCSVSCANRLRARRRKCV